MIRESPTTQPVQPPATDDSEERQYPGRAYVWRSTSIWKTYASTIPIITSEGKILERVEEVQPPATGDSEERQYPGRAYVWRSTSIGKTYASTIPIITSEGKILERGEEE